MMTFNESNYKHYFQVIDGKIVWEEPDMLKYRKKTLEGKRGYAIFKEAKRSITPNQYAYYFGGIIRSECMSSEVFQGLSEIEIHQALFSELRSTVKGIKLPNGKTRIIKVVEDFSSYNRKEMTRYIEEVIALLAVEYNIHVKPANKYRFRNFYINPKAYK